MKTSKISKGAYRYEDSEFIATIVKSNIVTYDGKSIWDYMLERKSDGQLFDDKINPFGLSKGEAVAIVDSLLKELKN